ncbi:MAG TPA: hypothetical protein ENH99_02755 [Candidatus Pacearchaeota archaeon]|nr:hypothetical protein [Candidatus Pacearchaeota archaeon]
MSRKKAELSLTERKKELIKLINDAEEMGFEPQLIKKYKKQLIEIEAKINQEKEKREVSK